MVRVNVGGKGGNLILTVEEGKRFRTGAISRRRRQDGPGRAAHRSAHRTVSAEGRAAAVVRRARRRTADALGRSQRQGGTTDTGRLARRRVGQIPRHAAEERTGLQPRWPAQTRRRLPSTSRSARHSATWDTTFPTSMSTLRPMRRRARADLCIKIVDEGPTAEIGTIEVGGHERNSREEVLDYLKIKPGDQLTRQRFVELQQRLWASARFIRSDVKPILPANRADKLALRIDLVEYAKAPKLSEPLCPKRTDPSALPRLAGGQQATGTATIVITLADENAMSARLLPERRGLSPELPLSPGRQEEPMADHTLIVVSAKRRSCMAHLRTAVLVLRKTKSSATLVSALSMHNGPRRPNVHLGSHWGLVGHSLTTSLRRSRVRRLRSSTRSLPLAVAREGCRDNVTDGSCDYRQFQRRVTDRSGDRTPTRRA